VGDWSIGGGKLKAREGPAYWLAGSPRQNGWLRARFDRPRPKGVLILRAALRKGRLKGLGLQLKGRKIRFVRFDGLNLKGLGPAFRLRPRKGMKRLEILALLLGGSVMLSAFDADDGAWLGSLGTRKAPKLEGSPGLFIKEKGLGALAFLSRWEECSHSSPLGLEGPPLILYFDPKQPPMARPGLRWMETLPERDVWRTDLPGLEQLFCEGQPPPRGFLTELPWKYLAPNYLQLRHQPPEETRDGFRINLSYKDPKMVEALLRGYHRRFPKQTQLQVLGQSRQGRPILALGIAHEIKARDPRPAFLLNSAHHGSEILSIEFTLDAIQSLLERPDVELERWLREAVIWCVPLINPDGLTTFIDESARVGRKNRHDVNGDGRQPYPEGVDLNRNYPFRWGKLGERGSRSSRNSPYYRGKRAASEPETQAMISLAQRERFVGSISYHTGTVAVLAPYTIPGVRNPEPNEAWVVAEGVAKALGTQPLDNRSFRVKRNLYPVDGVDQDWHRYAHGTLALLVEGGRWSPREMEARDRVVRVLRRSWKQLFRRFFEGPSLSLRVLDAQGRPLKAQVKIKEMPTRAGEKWKTRCPDGQFHRYLLKEGVLNLKLRSGKHKKKQRVEIKGRSKLEIIMKGTPCDPSPPPGDLK